MSRADAAQSPLPETTFVGNIGVERTVAQAASFSSAPTQAAAGLPPVYPSWSPPGVATPFPAPALNPKSPVLAAVLSLFIPGLGQIYNGDVKRGLLIILAQIISSLLTLIVIGFFTGLVLLIWAIFDAYGGAKARNEAAAAGFAAGFPPPSAKQCPRCGRWIAQGASVCPGCSSLV